MGPTLSNNANSASFDAGPLGKLYVNGDFSGLGYVQNNPGFDVLAGKHNKDDGVDFSNAMVTIQKDDGLVQFVVEAGGYSFPALGATYIKASERTSNSFGLVPVGYLETVPNSAFNFEVGQLPTLIGAELPFTFENANIERGLLWNQEPLISRGLQLNWSSGPWAVSAAWTDGYYSDQYTSISGEVTYTFKNSDTLEFAGAGNADTNLTCTAPRSSSDLGGRPHSRSRPARHPRDADRPARGPDLQPDLHPHQGAVDDNALLQYNSVPRDVVTGASASMWGAAVIAKYSFTPEISLAGRAEYEGSSGSYNMLYGPGSSAWSFTLTPTYQKGIFFGRFEVSYTGVGSGTAGLELRPRGRQHEPGARLDRSRRDVLAGHGQGAGERSLASLG